MIGIYKITNLLNDKCYIGQSNNIEKRWKKHKQDYKNIKSHSYNYPLYRAFRKYGIDNFSFEILEECLLKELDEKEIYYIKIYNAFFNGYNQTLGGDGSSLKEKENIIGVINDLKSTQLTHNEIAKKWNISTEMVQGINTGRYWHQNIEYPIQRKEISKEYSCEICGKKITKKSKFCIECYKKSVTTNNKPSRETLYNQLIEYKNFEAVGRLYNVSGNAIKKWCKKYGLPSNSKDYVSPKIKKEVRGITYPKKINMINPTTNEIINTFDSISEASKYLNISGAGSHISAVCQGKRKTAYGYNWSFVEQKLI